MEIPLNRVWVSVPNVCIIMALYIMSKKSRQLHKETAVTIATGLMINYPLNLTLLFIFLEVLEWNSTFAIGTTITAIMTCVAYTRVYTIRRYFHGKV